MRLVQSALVLPSSFYVKRIKPLILWVLVSDKIKHTITGQRTHSTKSKIDLLHLSFESIVSSYKQRLMEL